MPHPPISFATGSLAFKKFMFEDNPEAVLLYQLAVGGGGQQQTPESGGGGPQNQTGLPQGGAEQITRMMGGA